MEITRKKNGLQEFKNDLGLFFEMNVFAWMIVLANLWLYDLGIVREFYDAALFMADQFKFILIGYVYEKFVMIVYDIYPWIFIGGAILTALYTWGLIISCFVVFHASNGD